MPDEVFEHPRLVEIYDALDPDRSDLDVYAAIVDELGARRVLDVGCGTGTFALLLAAAGLQVIGVDPAAGSLEVARSKPGASALHWVVGDATSLPAMQVDVATMTGNAAQAIVEPTDWMESLRAVRAALRPGGTFVFETRNPAREAWLEWVPTISRTTALVAGVGEVTSWYELLDVCLPLVTFRGHWLFPDGAEICSDSTLRFREQDEVVQQLSEAGLTIVEVRDAPDRPGRELVFLARRRSL